MGLGVRDVAVLLCCLALALLALQQEGDLQVQPVFFQPLERAPDTTSGSAGGVYSRGAADAHSLMATYANGIAPLDSEVVPPPLITDLDGDGVNEVVLVTREPKLKIFRFRGGGATNQQFKTLYSHGGVDWDQMVLVREVGLLSSLAVTSGRQVVGLSSGYLRPYSPTRNRKQVLVLVNEGWGIMVFNHKLRLMWTRAIETDLSLKYLAEVAIVVDPHPMRKQGARMGKGAPRNDTGVIIVGGRLALKSSLHASSHVGVHVEPAGLGAGQAGPRPLEFPTDYAESLQGRILRPGRTRGTVTSDDDDDADGGGSDASPEEETLTRDPHHFDHDAHFSYYAFEGLTGDTRWRHDSHSFVDEEPAAGSDILRPQHDGALHSGEMDWRVFRQSILEYALPHAWEGGRDATRMDIAHVEKTRAGALRQREQAAHQVKSSFFVRDSPLGTLRPHSDSEHVANPNALVVHLRDGLELLHLYSGRPLCRLALRGAGQVHVDMDGDGVVDHVEAVGGIHRAHSLRARSTDEHHASSLPKCLAVVRSGIPPSRQLFNASICMSSWTELMRFGGLFKGSKLARATKQALDATANEEGSGVAGARGRTGRGGSAFSLEDSEGSTDDSGSSSSSLFGRSAGSDSELNQQTLQVAHPIVIQDPRTVGKSAKRRRFHSFFFLNTGLVSSFNHDGTRTWHTQTRAAWLHSSGAAGPQSVAAAAFRPTLTPFALRADTPSDHVLVLGERAASLVTLGGSIRVEWNLAPDLAVARPIVADFDNDGINDIVIITTRGYYGYSVTRRLGGQLFSLLALCLLLVLLAVFAFKLSQQDAFGIGAAKIRAGMTPQRARTTFTGALRPLKSEKAQL